MPNQRLTTLESALNVTKQCTEPTRPARPWVASTMTAASPAVPAVEGWGGRLSTMLEGRFSAKRTFCTLVSSSLRTSATHVDIWSWTWSCRPSGSRTTPAVSAVSSVMRALMECPSLWTLKIRSTVSKTTTGSLPLNVQPVTSPSFPQRGLMKPFELCPWTKTITWNAITVRTVRWSWMMRRVTAATLWTATFSATPATWSTSSPAPPSATPPTNTNAGGGRHLVDIWRNCQRVNVGSRRRFVQFLL